MNNQEILEAAIKKAIDGGWKEQGIKWMFQLHELVDIDDFDMSNPNNFNVLIFNHDFAKALWGAERPEEGVDYYYSGPETNWEWHLQQMVIADDPIKYLGDTL